MWDKPAAPWEVELDDAGTVMLVEPEGARIMPSRSTVLTGAVPLNSVGHPWLILRSTMLCYRGSAAGLMMRDCCCGTA